MCYGIHVNGRSGESFVLVVAFRKAGLGCGGGSSLHVDVPLQVAVRSSIPRVAEPDVTLLTAPGTVCPPFSPLAAFAASPLPPISHREVQQWVRLHGCCHSTRSLPAVVVPDQLPRKLQPELNDGVESCAKRTCSQYATVFSQYETTDLVGRTPC